MRFTTLSTKNRQAYGWQRLILIVVVALGPLSTFHWSRTLQTSFIDQQNGLLHSEEPTTMKGVSNCQHDEKSQCPEYLSEFRMKETFDTRTEAFFQDFNYTNGKNWMKDYITWHNKQRKLFPETEILTHPGAPKVLIVYFPHHSEGLAGRFQLIGRLLFLCNWVRRLLLIKFTHPMPLETFLLPSLFNWTVPYHNTTVTEDVLVASYRPQLPENDNEKVVIMEKATGHMQRPPQLLRSAPESNIPYHVYWQSFFQPSPFLDQALNDAYHQLGLQRGVDVYDAIHCRVRHPAFRGTFGGEDFDHARGLLFANNESRMMALQSAQRAVQCSNWLAKNHPIGTDNQLLTRVPTYFFSDAEELVRSLTDSAWKKQDTLEQDAYDLSVRSSVIGRYGMPVAHLEELHQTVDAYAASFVDLYIAAGARCITMGVGRFGYLASRISGTSCRLLHDTINTKAKHVWNLAEMQESIPHCPNPVPL